MAGFDIHDMQLLNRITWGINLSAVRAMNRVGAEAYLEQQLRPSAESDLPAQAQVEIDVLTISQRLLEELVAETDLQGKSANAIVDTEQKQAAQKAYQETLNRLGREAATRSLLRDLYSPHQLQEQLSWFWLNHFNVHLYKSNIRVLIGDYEDRAIRSNALGRIRDILSATLHHPAMLRYLDNDQNAAGHLNENYAREIMERHRHINGFGAKSEVIAGHVEGPRLPLSPSSVSARDYQRCSMALFSVSLEPPYGRGTARGSGNLREL